MQVLEFGSLGVRVRVRECMRVRVRHKHPNPDHELRAQVSETKDEENFVEAKQLARHAYAPFEIPTEVCVCAYALAYVHRRLHVCMFRLDRLRRDLTQKVSGSWFLVWFEGAPSCAGQGDFVRPQGAGRQLVHAALLVPCHLDRLPPRAI